MAGKTNTDLIRELDKEVAGQSILLSRLGGDIARVESAHTKTADTLAPVITRVTILEEKFADLKKSLEESDRKRWMLSLAVIGTFLTLVANLVVTFLRK